MLTIKQGKSWGREYPILDPDDGLPMVLTGWTLRGQIRASASSTDVLYEWDSATDNATVEAGLVRVFVPAATSANFSWRRAGFDIELVAPDARTVQVDSGTVVVVPEFTH